MVTYKGGDGSSIDDAIEIQGASSIEEGVTSEYQYISNRFGKRGIDWELEEQRLRSFDEIGKHYDMINIRLMDGTKKTLYFDITSFFGKEDKKGC